MKHNYTIKKDNVLLRPLCEDDIEMLRIWRNNPENSKYLRQIGYIDKDQQKKWFENYINNDDEIAFAIVECKELNRLVGSVSLYNFKDNEAEFGKILIGDEEAHGKRIGLNATKAAIEIGFKELNLNRIVLEVNYENVAAIKTYEKAGFMKCYKDDINYYYEILADFKGV